MSTELVFAVILHLLYSSISQRTYQLSTPTAFEVYRSFFQGHPSVNCLILFNKKLRKIQEKPNRFVAFLLKILSLLPLQKSPANHPGTTTPPRGGARTAARRRLPARLSSARVPIASAPQTVQEMQRKLMKKMGFSGQRYKEITNNPLFTKGPRKYSLEKSYRSKIKT